MCFSPYRKSLFNFLIFSLSSFQSLSSCSFSLSFRRIFVSLFSWTLVLYAAVIFIKEKQQQLSEVHQKIGVIEFHPHKNGAWLSCRYIFQGFFKYQDTSLILSVNISLHRIKLVVAFLKRITIVVFMLLDSSLTFQ